MATNETKKDKEMGAVPTDETTGMVADETTDAVAKQVTDIMADMTLEAGTAENPVHATPASARIYLSGCVLTLAGAAAVRAGQQDVVVDCLVDGFAEDSIQVRVPEGTELLSVSVIHPKAAGEGLDEAKSEVAELERQISRIDKRIATRQEQRERWLSPALGGSSKEGFSALEGYLDGLSGHLDAIDDEVLSLEEERESLARDLTEAKGRLQEIETRLGRGLLSMRVLSERGGTMPFEVSMRSARASWKPMHDVFVPDFGHPMSVRMRAEIRQETGIDWDGVSLALSTARPSVGQALPRLRHLAVTYETADRLRLATSANCMKDRYVSAKGTADKTVHREMMATGHASVAPTMPQMILDDTRSLGIDPAELANSQEYGVPGTWDVPDGEATVVDIRTTEVGATYRWLAYPTLTDEVHIVASPDVPLTSVIVGDEVAVHIGREYCGKVRVPRAEQGKAEVLSLGPDSMMSASSTRSTNRTRGGSFLKNKSIMSYAYELEVRSSRTEEVPLSVVAAVPVSEDGEVAVTLADGFDGTFDEETGEVRWDVTIDSHDTVSKRFEYDVSYPRSGSIWVHPRD